MNYSDEKNQELFYKGYNPYLLAEDHVLDELGDKKPYRISPGVLYPNKVYILKDSQENTLACKVNHTNTELNMIHLKDSIYNFTASDLKQKLALENIFNNDILINVVLGSSGVGKTFISLGSALWMLQKKIIKSVFLIKPMVGVSKNKYMGALPGSLDEKTAPFLDSFYDVAASLGKVGELEHYLESEQIQFLPLDFLRGRNLANSLIIVDEAQNLNKHDLLAICTRVARGSKIIILADPNKHQHDINETPGLLTLVSDLRFWNSQYTSCIHLSKKMRSEIVELVEDILSP